MSLVWLGGGGGGGGVGYKYVLLCLLCESYKHAELFSTGLTEMRESWLILNCHYVRADFNLLPVWHHLVSSYPISLLVIFQTL